MNDDAYEALLSRTIGDLQKAECSDAVTQDKFSQNLQIYNNILGTLVDRGAKLPRDGVFLDFGAGQGYAAIAAAQRMRHSIICDLHTENAQIGLRWVDIENVTIIDEVARVPHTADVLFMWHALEHIPEPSEFWKHNRQLLNQNAEIILQVPTLRREYVVDAHFVFFNERSLRAWFDRIGASIRVMLFDKEHDFLSAIGNLVD